MGAYWQNKGAALKELHRYAEAKEAFAKRGNNIWKKEEPVMVFPGNMKI